EQVLKAMELEGTEVDSLTRVIHKKGTLVGVEVEGQTYSGFPTPSRKLEFYSKTLKEWNWPEFIIPTYAKSHVHQDNIDSSKGEMLLLPTFRLPTLIHSRSGNAKWLYEISHRNPVWLHPQPPERMSLATGDLVRLATTIGYFVDRVWITEGIRPGVVACSHHLGRWRLQGESGGERWSTALGGLKQAKPGQWM